MLSRSSVACPSRRKPPHPCKPVCKPTRFLTVGREAVPFSDVVHAQFTPPPRRHVPRGPETATIDSPDHTSHSAPAREDTACSVRDAAAKRALERPLASRAPTPCRTHGAQLSCSAPSLAFRCIPRVSARAVSMAVFRVRVAHAGGFATSIATSYSPSPAHSTLNTRPWPPVSDT